MSLDADDLPAAFAAAEVLRPAFANISCGFSDWDITTNPLCAGGAGVWSGIACGSSFTDVDGTIYKQATSLEVGVGDLLQANRPQLDSSKLLDELQASYHCLSHPQQITGCNSAGFAPVELPKSAFPLLTGLQVLTIRSNVGGSLPAEIGALHDLTAMDLSGNNFVK
jgi:hypothetical protein